MKKHVLALLFASILAIAFSARPVGAFDLVLENGWVPRSADSKAEAFVDEGIVHLKGEISSGTSPVLFTLPPALRPVVDQYVSVYLDGIIFSSPKGRLWIRPNGVVTVQDEEGDLVDPAIGTSLDGARFALSASGFTPLSLVNGWVGAPYSTSAPAAALIDGIVHLKGAVANGTNEQILTLPAGLRPATTVQLRTNLCDAATGTLQVEANGIITVSANYTFADAQCFTSLDGVSFALSGSGFTAVPLLSDWTNFATNPAAVSMVDGIVRFKGAVARPALTPGLAFVLPPEMRPATSISIPIDSCSSPIGALYIDPNGDVSIGGAGLGSECGASLDGASFVVPAPRSFTNVELLNGWTNGVFATAATAVVLNDGLVHFRGAVSNGTTDHLFTLPVTLRPETNVYVSADLCSGKPGRLLFQPSGHVFVQTASGIFADAQCFTSLEGVKYAPYANAFTPLTLWNGWGDLAFGTSRASFARIDGMIHLKGGIYGGTAAGLFTLPPEARPETNVYVSVNLCGSAKGRLFIQPSGFVEVEPTSAFSAAQCFTSLDGVYFATSTNGFAPLAPGNGWTNTPYGTHAPAATIVRDIAYLEGAIANGASADAFILPPILRPLSRVYESIDLVNGAKGRVIIEPSGQLSVFALGPFSDAQGFASLDGVSYSVPEPGALPALVSGILLLAGLRKSGAKTTGRGVAASGCSSIKIP